MTHLTGRTAVVTGGATLIGAGREPAGQDPVGIGQLDVRAALGFPGEVGLEDLLGLGEVRKPVGELPSGWLVLGLADAIMLNDPIPGAGFEQRRQDGHGISGGDPAARRQTI
ncbi:MAG: hypothetical protein ACRDPA_09290 [Solirubrobacteraceae bacterium]